MIMEALTASAFPITRFIRTVAVLAELFLYAFHLKFPFALPMNKFYILQFSFCNAKDLSKAKYAVGLTYFPIQKSLNILFNISSVVTAPTISPSLSSESLSSKAKISRG